MPSGIYKLNLRLLISGYILAEFLVPELPVRLRISGESATRMPVPEATVNENHGPVFRQHDVRGSRQITAVQSKTIPKLVQHLPYCQLRFRVLSPDGGHVAASHC